jgi:drug/metabolite transporter (DMT)-like permease
LAFVMIFLGQFVQRINTETTLTWQLSGGFIALSFVMPFYMHRFPTDYIFPTAEDWMWLLFLGWVCSVLAFQLTAKALKKLSAFTINLTFNLEPVYGILLAFILFHENKNLSKWFYYGFALIASSLIIHAIILLKKKKAVTDAA